MWLYSWYWSDNDDILFLVAREHTYQVCIVRYFMFVYLSDGHCDITLNLTAVSHVKVEQFYFLPSLYICVGHCVSGVGFTTMLGYTVSRG